MNTFRLFSFLMIIWSLPISAQNEGSLGIRDFEFSKVLQLIEDGDYERARQVQQAIDAPSQKDDKAFDYLNNILSLKLDNNEQPAIEFVKAYPGTLYSQLLSSYLGDYYYSNRKFGLSIVWYEKGRTSTDKDRFQLANAYYKMKQSEKALSVYRTIKDPEYKSMSMLNAGKILWDQNQKTEAIKYFKNLTNEETLKNQVIPYLSDFYFANKDFGLAIEYGNQFSSDKKSNTQARIFLILANSYLKLKDFDHSLEYFRLINSDFPGFLTTKDSWNLASVAIALGDYELAQKVLNEIIQKNDTLKQAAAYQLGLLQLNQEAYDQSVASFQVSIEGNDPVIVRKSLLNLAKAEFQLGLYDEVIINLTKYQELYPMQDKVVTSELITQSYFQNSDYEKTISYIASQERLTPQIRKIYQWVTFENGNRYFIDQNLEDAIHYLKLSLKYPIDRALVTKAKYLLAESHAYQGNYHLAIPLYQQVHSSPGIDINTKIQTIYGLAFAQYNSKNYNDALQTFERLVDIQETPLEMLTEADVRIADCHYINKDYEEAINYYGRLKSSRYRPYVLYQLGHIYELMDQPNLALSTLTNIIQVDSILDYKSESYFLTGQIYLDQGAYEKSIESFNHVIDDFPTGIMTYEALLEKSLAASNNNDLVLAEKSLKTIIDDSNQPDLAKNALLGLQALQAKGLKITDFDSYFEKVARTQPESNELMNIAYEAAKAPYFRQEYELAANRIKQFIEDYTSNHPLEAFYYLGDSYFRLKKWQEAIQSFEKYLENGINQLSGRVLDKRGQSYLQLQNFDKAESNYKFWLQNAANSRESYQARMGLIEAYKFQNEPQIIIDLIKEQEQNAWKPINAELSLSILKSEMYELLNQKDKANDELIQIMNNAEGENAAIAHYRLARLMASDSNYQQSNETLLKLIGEFGSYPTWSQKAYLQLIDNYVALDNQAQAIATAQSIIDNSSDSTFILATQSKLEDILKDEINNPADSIDRNE